MSAIYYELSEEDKELIQFHNKTFKEIEDIGFNILDHVLVGQRKLENYKIPIRSILYRLLELNDTLNVMVQNSLINTSFSILRNEFETYIQILYLLQDKDQIEEKALLYHYCDIVRMNSFLEKEQLNEFLFRHEYLDAIHQKYFTEKHLLKREWYKLYDKKMKLFKNLCKKVGKEEDYNNLYAHLSADIHGTGNIELNTFYDDSDGKYYLSEFRNFERHHTLMIYHIEFFRNIFLQIIDFFETDKNIKDKVSDFYSRVGRYIDDYKKIKGTILDPLPVYSI